GLRYEELLTEAVEEAEREVAVSDRGAVRALVLGTLDVHVDPLVVARDVGELVDVVLADLAPVAGPEGLPDELLELVDSVHGCGGHGAEAYPWWYQGLALKPF